MLLLAGHNARGHALGHGNNKSLTQFADRTCNGRRQETQVRKIKKTSAGNFEQLSTWMRQRDPSAGGEQPATSGKVRGGDLQ